jgi:predicted Zn-dependent peptidase
MKYKKVTLDNGLKVITCPMPHTRSVSVLFFVMSGSCYETDEVAGISHFIEHMCFKGTKKRPSSMAISEAIEGVGGIMNGGTDRQLTSYWCKLASQHLELAIDVIVDLLRNPLFRREDIVKERQVIIEEINMSLDSPQQRVCMLFDELMWPGKPMGRDVAGSKETVSSITKKQMLEVLNGSYTPDNMLVSIAGDMQPSKVLDVLNKSMKGWDRGRQLQYLPSNSKQSRPRLKMEFRETEQMNLMLGVEGYSMFHPDRYAVDLISMILGEGMSSRLFTEIREKLGLTYDIHSYVEHYKETGSFVVQAGLDPQQTGKAISAILEQLDYMRESTTEQELHKAIEMAKGRLLLSMENSRNVAGWYGAQEALTGKILTVDDVTRIIEGITVGDIRRVAGQIFVTEKLNMAAVGPVKETKKIGTLLKL